MVHYVWFAFDPFARPAFVPSLPVFASGEASSLRIKGADTPEGGGRFGAQSPCLICNALCYTYVYCFVAFAAFQENGMC